jgi:hypothetical protein
MSTSALYPGVGWSTEAGAAENMGILDKPATGVSAFRFPADVPTPEKASERAALAAFLRRVDAKERRLLIRWRNSRQIERTTTCVTTYRIRQGNAGVYISRRNGQGYRFLLGGDWSATDADYFPDRSTLLNSLRESGDLQLAALADYLVE